MARFVVLTTTCIYLMLANSASTTDKELPRMVLNMLSHVGEQTNFIDVFEMRGQVMNFTSSAMLIPERGSDGGQFVELQDEVCRPRPVVVKVGQPTGLNSFRYPFYVKLYRCQGGCGAASFVSQCDAVSIKLLQVRVAEISWSSLAVSDVTDLTRRLTFVAMHNETRCACACRNRRPVCSQFQEWSERTCRCECIFPCPMNYVPDAGRCCKCMRPFACFGRRAWNPEKCSCECRKQECRNRMKSRHPETCRCVCRPIVCRYGGIQDQRSCRCTHRTSVRIPEEKT